MSKIHEAKMPSLGDQIEQQALEEEKNVKRKIFRKRKKANKERGSGRSPSKGTKGEKKHGKRK